MKPGYSIAAIAVAVALGSAVSVQAAKSPPVISTAPLTDSSTPGTLPYVTLLSSSFEVTEGFVVGPLEPQNGYTASGVNSPWVSVSLVDPAVGLQHLREIKDPTVGAGTLRVALTPTVVVPANSPSTTTQLIKVSNVDGADYDFVGQAPSQGFLSWRVKFLYSDGAGGPGDIYVLDDIGAGLQFVDTGVAWVPGVYKELKVQFDPGASEIRYFYDGVLIYTGFLIFAGTSIEQLVWVNDNFQLNALEFGDVDAVVLTDSPHDPVPVRAASWGEVKARYR